MSTDTEKLSTIAAVIHAGRQGPIEVLIKMLQDVHGMKMTTPKSGITTVVIAGFTHKSRNVPARIALENWGNAARRTVKEMTV